MRRTGGGRIAGAGHPRQDSPSPAETGRPGPGLLGRRSECEVLDRLVAEVAAGSSRTLVLRGDPGTGKSALLAHLAERTAGWCVVAATCVEQEAELAYSGLHQLCAPLLEYVDDLAPPQGEALGTVFGLNAGPAPDRFLVGLAALSLIARAAENGPLACVVDDAHWLDPASAQVLAFVARRLRTERVAVVCAVRAGVGDDVLAGQPVLPIGGLDEDHARALLLAALHVPLDPVVRDRVVAESRGNPRALLAPARTWSAADLAGGYGLPPGRPVAGSAEQRVEECAVDHLLRLPPDTQLLVLTAALEPCGDPVLLQRAARALGVDAAAVVPAADAGLLRVRRRVEFAHPLVRSAVHRRAEPDDRRRVHRALAEATDAETDPDRHAWHRACSTAGPDDEAAAALERTADLARVRGGLPAAAAFLTRATELTADPQARSHRALAAASATLRAGELDAVRALLALASEEPLDEPRRARIDLLNARLVAATSPGGGATSLLLAAARRLENVDVRLAREAHLDALTAAVLAAPAGGGGDQREVAGAARAAPRPPGDGTGALDLLLEALAALVEDDDAAAALCRAALRELCFDPRSTEAGRGLGVACAVACDVWDDESWYVLSERHVSTARREGALGELPHAVDSRVTLMLLRGDLLAAAALVEEELPTRGPGGSGTASVAVAAWEGRGDVAREAIDRAVREAAARGDDRGVARGEHARALLCNGLGRHEEALIAAGRARERSPHRVGVGLVLPELVEAAVRTGQLDRAADALQQLSRRARASGTDWGLGIAARSLALLGGGGADGLFRAAIGHLGRTRVRSELARTHLLYGEWLRASGRRADARGQLAVAHELFSGMGMDGFADRARRELHATGLPARRPATPSAGVLTAQEARIAWLARDGLSNPEIGAQLFLSARTVEWHLRKVFPKLAITSRRQLRRALSEPDRPATDG